MAEINKMILTSIKHTNRPNEFSTSTFRSARCSLAALFAVVAKTTQGASWSIISANAGVAGSITVARDRGKAARMTEAVVQTGRKNLPILWHFSPCEIPH